MLLSKYLRGFVLFIWEVLVNTLANVNLAIIYSFQGEIDKAINVLDTRWLLVYLPVYLFGIWDSYRTTVDLNQVYILSNHEEHRFNSFIIDAVEINYLDKRNPIMAAIWSLFVPGLGQLYIHRILSTLFVTVWSLFFFYMSNTIEALHLIIIGEIQLATSVINGEWLLMLPSLYGFSIYDAYVNTVENNKLFEKEQRRYLKDNYQHPDFRVLKGQKGK
ncbi:hypothetical protein [Paenisporosarcina sp. TG20]|uniref:hypothetical protein n=1 Tax=Paenisporosarcina sp. TG20 TaxID=1211706 RepID=UPI00030BFC7F|nr:hypothetical protein [Paenisporosarcina sp. TG20]